MPIRKNPVDLIRQLALAYPDTVEGVSCNNAAFKVRGKAFVFLGEKPDTYNFRLKLSESLPEAEQLADKQPEVYSPGMHGWTHVVLPQGKSPPVDLLKRWIDESFRLLAPKSLLAELPVAGKKPTKKKPAKTTERTSVKKRTGKSTASSAKPAKRKSKRKSTNKRSSK